MDFNNWQAYISNYCKRYCLGAIAPISRGRFIILQSPETRVVFVFEDKSLNQLLTVLFYSQHTGFRMYYSALGGPAEANISLQRKSLKHLERFLSIPMVYGWEERKTYIEGEHILTESFSQKTGVIPFCSEFVSGHSFYKARHIFGHHKTFETRSFNGVVSGFTNRYYLHKTMKSEVPVKWN